MTAETVMPGTIICRKLLVMSVAVSCCLVSLIAVSHAQSTNTETTAGVADSRQSVIAKWRKAIANDQVDELARLWQQSSDQKTLLATRTENGKDAFMIASKTGHVQLFELLLDAGADPDSSTVTGGTPIMFAALGNHPQLVNRLIAVGADPNRQGSNGWSALTIAAAKGFPEMIRLLVSVGAQPGLLDVYRWTPLMRAVDNLHNDTVKILLSFDDVDVHQQDEAGNTALHYAVVRGNAEAAAALLAAGADPDVLNRERQSPRQLALTGSVSESLSSLFDR